MNLKTSVLPLIKASESVLLKFKEDWYIVIYESTVYPGATEDILCATENNSGLKFNTIFQVTLKSGNVN
jgi:UDP-N-acetyl-D-mannosaminuronate dehydrogenase